MEHKKTKAETTQPSYLVTFAPQTFQAAMPLAMVGGLIMLGWNVTMAVRMFRMGRAAGREPMAAPAAVMP